MFVIIKGAGDLASGIALRLRHAGFDIAMTEIPKPSAVRRTVCFSQAVYEGRAKVEDLFAVLARDDGELRKILDSGNIAVIVDPRAECVKRLSPDALVDAVMVKRNTGTAVDDAPVVIGVGPGFTAPSGDCRAVVETQRGHTLGRVITEGGALPDTGVPGDIGGYTIERLLRAPADGIFEGKAEIGDRVKKGRLLALVRNMAGDGSSAARDGAGEAVPLYAGIDGVLRGMLPSGFTVHKGMKAGDIDPRCDPSHCFTVSDKALAVAGGVLEALLRFGL
ncbi:MAG: EF2563 family selenium-dependent molybdenum hydroxylase system protein [Treponema sp.]|jgi:xanthine dehydrogenase accessory factor|nr:EF2563 family selenium-dependent molybdenum hydroxylase system protein [Treponema sp.]